MGLLEVIEPSNLDTSSIQRYEVAKHAFTHLGKYEVNYEEAFENQENIALNKISEQVIQALKELQENELFQNCRDPNKPVLLALNNRLKNIYANKVANKVQNTVPMLRVVSTVYAFAYETLTGKPLNYGELFQIEDDFVVSLKSTLPAATNIYKRAEQYEKQLGDIVETNLNEKAQSLETRAKHLEKSARAIQEKFPDKARLDKLKSTYVQLFSMDSLEKFLETLKKKYYKILQAVRNTEIYIPAWRKDKGLAHYLEHTYSKNCSPRSIEKHRESYQRALKEKNIAIIGAEIELFKKIKKENSDSTVYDLLEKHLGAQKDDILAKITNYQMFNELEVELLTSFHF